MPAEDCFYWVLIPYWYNFRLVVALLREVHVFSFPAPAQRLYTVETRENTLGLCEISPIVSAERQLLAFPGHKIGSVQLVVSQTFNQH